jgi:hypothetical protein
MKRTKIKTEKEKKIINIYKRIEHKSSGEIFLESLKENRKILINMSAVLLVAPWVRVEFTTQIYLSLYFSFKKFHDDTAFLKRNVQRKAERKGSKWTSLTTVILWFSWCTHLCS